jgi:hypothetical protein
MEIQIPQLPKPARAFELIDQDAIAQVRQMLLSKELGHQHSRKYNLFQRMARKAQAIWAMLLH